MDDQELKPTKFLTITAKRPDLDSALAFVVQAIETNKLDKFPDIAITATWDLDQETREHRVVYVCQVQGHEDDGTNRYESHFH